MLREVGVTSEEVTSRTDAVEEADVVVIGSGMAGICAAIQASRLGCSVILLEKDEVFGGNSGPNLGIHISGAHSFHPYASETGIINEIEEEAACCHAKTHAYRYHYNISRQWDSILKMMMDSSGVKAYRRNYAKTAITEGNRIRSVIVEDLATFKTKRVDVGVALIDASGDGQVAFSAGAEFRMGREARGEFNERGAPEVADRITMGTSVTALVRKAERPIKFVPPPDTPPFKVGYGYGRDRVSTDCLYAHASWSPDADLCFLWHTETGGHLDTIEDDHEIYETLIKHLYSVWNHIKNEAHQKESENWELVWVSPKAGKRESRRFMGDYILTQNDVENATPFPDAVAYGGYAVDVHDPVGDQAKVVFHSVPPLYSIPYRCLYSRNIDNLLLAGRLISVTHMALGTVRLQKTLAAAGQAVGAAAALCKRYRCTPRDIYREHIGELQQLLLREDATIIGVRNEDPGDLARSAKVTATSEEHFECTEFDDFLPLDRTRGIMLWDWGEKLRSVQLYLMNERGHPAELTLSLELYRSEGKYREPSPVIKPSHIRGPGNRMEWGGDNTIAKFQPVATSRATVPPNFVGWVEFRFSPEVALIGRDMTSDEDRYVLTLGSSEGVWWGRRKGLYDFAVRCWASKGDERYATEPELHLFRIDPRPPYGEASNVINGYNRRFSTNPVNMWISKRGEPLPQSLTLDFGRPVEFNEVRITFDTLYRSYLEMPFNSGDEVPEMCVKDYELEMWDGSSWKGIVSVRDNYRRFRIHRFGRVRSDRLRLVVAAVNGEGYGARIYEIRVYNASESRTLV